MSMRRRSKPSRFLVEMAYGKKTHLRFRGREVYSTEGSCRFPLIVLQQTTQSFFATHDPVCPSIRQWEQKPYRGGGEGQSQETTRGCKPRLFKPVEFLDLTRNKKQQRDDFSRTARKMVMRQDSSPELEPSRVQYNTFS